MKQIPFESTVTSAFGKPLSAYNGKDGKPLPAEMIVKGTYDAFDDIHEVRDKGEFPSEKQIVNMLNNQSKANAKAKAVADALEAAGVTKPTLETDAQLRLKNIIDAVVADGKTPRAVAIQQAETLVGAKWEGK